MKQRDIILAVLATAGIAVPAVAGAGELKAGAARLDITALGYRNGKVPAAKLRPAAAAKLPAFTTAVNARIVWSLSMPAPVISGRHDKSCTTS